MKRALKHTSSIYEYLEESGLLNTGTDAEIEEARKKYWKNYRAAYQRQKRKEQHVFTVSFTKKELQQLKPVVQKHKCNYTIFIKQATLAYSLQQFVVIDSAAVNEIRELLTKNYTILQNIEEQLSEGDIHFSVIKKFSRMEQKITQYLHRPDTLEKAIRDSIKSSPDYRHTILKLLES